MNTATLAERNNTRIEDETALGVSAIRFIDSAQVKVARQKDAFRPGLALRLTAAFLLLTAVPLVGAVVSLLAIAGVKDPLTKAAAAADYQALRAVQVEGRLAAVDAAAAAIADGLPVNSPAAASSALVAAAAELRLSLEAIVTPADGADAGALKVALRRLEVAAKALARSAELPVRSSAGDASAELLARRAEEFALYREELAARIATMDAAERKRLGEAHARAGRALQRLGVGSVVGATVCGGLALALLLFFVYPAVVRRLQRLSLAYDRLRAGNVSGPIRGDGDDELAKLASALEDLRGRAIAQREVELSLKNCERNLERVNEERNRFARAATLDLKAPLRAIRNLAGFIEEDLDAKHDVYRHLDTMRGRISRLDLMIDALLDFSRIGARRPKPLSVDLYKTVAAAATVAAKPYAGRVVIAGPAVAARTWAQPLQTIVRELVDNAFKHHDRDDGRVTLDWTVQRRCIRLGVRDDGPGIAPRYHKQVFGILKTLKPRDEVEGSGMGLAVLKKLVHTYGGSVHIDSDPEVQRGTTLVVNWPLAPDET